MKNLLLEKKLLMLAEKAETSFLAGAQWRVLRAIKQISFTNNLPYHFIYQILNPSRILEVILPVEFKGKIYLCKGFRAWFDNGRPHKPGEIVKGGIRFLSFGFQKEGGIISLASEEKAREVALEDVMALGLEMLAKNSGANFKNNVLRHFGLNKRKKILSKLDVAGGAKGVIAAPKSLHDADHNQFVRKALEVFGYKLGLSGMVGWDRDVPAGDIGTTGTINGASVLDGFADGYQKAIKELKIKMPRNLQLASVTGKTANKRYLGNKARQIATGYGTVEALKCWCQDKKIKLKDLTVVFDGAGNAALPAAKFLINSGIKVVGITDSRSAIMVKKGLTLKDLEDITRFKLERKSLREWSFWANKINKTKSYDFMEKSLQLDKAKQELWRQSNMNVLFISSDAMIINAKNVFNLPKNILIVDPQSRTSTVKA